VKSATGKKEGGCEVICQVPKVAAAILAQLAQGRWNSGLHQSEGVSVPFISVAVTIHAVDEVFYPPAVFRPAHFRPDA
jgi:hypothetical protein